jgi:hypothetical protein
LALNVSAGQTNLEFSAARNLERPNSAAKSSTRILSDVLHNFKESRDLNKKFDRKCHMVNMESLCKSPVSFF